MSISISGPVFSSLVFRLKNAPSDAEGFFLGSVRSHHVENITDTQSSGTREEKKVYIESFVTYSERYKFYDHFGIPHPDRVSALLGEEARNVVGWFSYRRNTSHRLSLRERVVHRRLMECFTAINNRDFLFGLVTEQVLDQTTVQSTDYSFYNWIGTSLKLVKVDILNLHITATIPYQLLPITHVPSSLPQYSSVLQEHRSKFTNSTGHMVQAQMAEQLYKSVLERLKPLCDQLSEATAAVVEEGRQVGELEAELERLMEEERGTQTEDRAKPQPSTAPDSLTSVSHGNTMDHAPPAVPLIDFESEPVTTELIGPVPPIIDLSDSLQEPPNLRLSQEGCLLINSSNNNIDDTKPLPAAPNHWPSGAERGEEEEGVVMANPNADTAMEGEEGEGEGEGEEVRGEVVGEMVSEEAAEPVQGSQQELF